MEELKKLAGNLEEAREELATWLESFAAHTQHYPGIELYLCHVETEDDYSRTLFLVTGLAKIWAGSCEDFLISPHSLTYWELERVADSIPQALIDLSAEVNDRIKILTESRNKLRKLAYSK